MNAFAEVVALIDLIADTETKLIDNTSVSRYKLNIYNIILTVIRTLFKLKFTYFFIYVIYFINLYDYVCSIL